MADDARDRKASGDSENSGFLAQWGAGIARCVYISAVLGFWLAVVEVFSYTPGALFKLDDQFLMPKLAGILSDPLGMDSIRDNLVCFTFAGIIIGGLAGLACFPISRKLLKRDRSQSQDESLVIAAFGLLLIGAFFYIPNLLSTYTGHIPGPPGAARSVAALVILIALLYLMVRYYRRLDPDYFTATLFLQSLWIMAGFVFLVMAHNRHPGIFLETFLYLVLAGLCYLCFRLMRAGLSRLYVRAGFRRSFSYAGMILSGALICYTCYYHFWGFKRLPLSGGGASGGPNLVMVVIDTVRADRLSCYGYARKTTPFIDSIAAEGVRFTRAYTPSPWTLPSHATFFTGLYPSEHRCINGNWWLESGFTTLAERLKERGYITLAYSCNPWISKYSNLGQGFDLLLNARHIFTGSSMFSGGRALRAWMFVSRPGLMLMDNGAAQANIMCRDWLGALSRKKAPFFLFINYMEAHPPYPLHNQTYRFFPDPDDGPRIIKQADFNWVDHDSGLRPLTEKVGETASAWYDGCLYYLDRNIEELAQTMKERGLDSNTVLIILSDHGELLGEHGLWGHEFSMYHSLLRVPLIIRYPGQLPKGVEAEGIFSLRELPELTMNILGGRAREAVSAYMEAPGDPSDKPVFAERFPPKRTIELFKFRNPNFDETLFDRSQKSVIAWPHHLIWDSKGEDELYKVDADPGELNDLAGEEPEAYNRLVNTIREFRLSHPDPLKDRDGDKELDPDMAEKLKALGYIK